MRDRGLPNVLDFPLQEALAGFAGGDAGARGIATRLGDDDYFRLADGRAPVPPTFLGNHDMGRAALKIQERSHVSGDALLRRTLLGHDLLYLLRGAPTVLYGDEVGLIGRGGDQQARQDLFPTQVDEWRTQQRIGSGPIGGGSSFDQPNHPVAQRLRTLAALRDAHPGALDGRVGRPARAGQRARRHPLRRRGAQGVRGGVQQRHEPGARHRRDLDARAAWTTLLGTGTATGSLTLTIPPLSSLLLRADAALPARRPARPALRVAGDNLTVLAAVGDERRRRVRHLRVKRRTGGWRRVAVDDSPPFRAFLDAARYRRNEPVHLVAIARGVGREPSTSRVVPFTVRRR